MADHAYLDHLAVAAPTWEELWPRYRAQLGGVWVSGDRQPGVGFGPAQFRYANRMKVELLQPVRPQDNDFLQRFLDSRGPGPHHVTFKVPDIVAKLAEVEAAGYRPVGVDLRDPGWQEAFIHPKDGPGIVVQIAQAAHEWSSPEPTNLPAAGAPSSLDYLAIGAAEYDRAVALFTELLDGDLAGANRDDLFGYDYAEITWPTGGVIRLFAAATSGLHHAAFTVDNPLSVAGATPLDDGRYDVAAEVNLGVRLVLA